MNLTSSCSRPLPTRLPAATLCFSQACCCPFVEDHIQTINMRNRGSDLACFHRNPNRLKNCRITRKSLSATSRAGEQDTKMGRQPQTDSIRGEQRLPSEQPPPASSRTYLRQLQSPKNGLSELEESPSSIFPRTTSSALATISSTTRLSVHVSWSPSSSVRYNPAASNGHVKRFFTR